MAFEKKNFSQVDHEVTNEAGLAGGALIVGWKNAIGDMFRMSFDNFKAMVLTWITKEQVGLGNVNNTSDADKPVSMAVASALEDKADLVDGKVPAAQLPSYVDDVLEYADFAAFPAEGESSKIYIAIDTNQSYRWSGTIYVEINAGGGLTFSQVYAGITLKI